MYAIVQQGGHQYRVSPGDRLVVDRLDAEVGSVVALEPVLLLEAEAGDVSVGSPAVDGARVAAVVVAHPLGRKIRVFKYKPKKHYRRTRGHRSRLTELRVEAVLAAGEPLPEVAAAAPKVAEPEDAETSRPKARAKAKAGAAVEAPSAAEVEPAESPTPAPRRRRTPAAAAPAAEAATGEPGTPETDATPATED